MAKGDSPAAKTAAAGSKYVVYCPEHGELSDPGNQGLQDHSDPGSPVLCRACGRPLQLQDPATVYEDCRGWVWHQARPVLRGARGRWLLMRVGDENVVSLEVGVVWLGMDAAGGWHLWLTHGPSVSVEPDPDPRKVMDAAGPQLLSLARERFEQAHDRMKAAGDLLVTVLAHLERKEDR